MKTKTIYNWVKTSLLAGSAFLFGGLQASADTAAASSSSSSAAPSCFSLSSCGIGATAPGQFSNLAIFTLNAGSGDVDTFSGNSSVLGGVAVSGSGKLTLTNSARIQGNLSYRSNGTLSKASTATITGSIYKNSSTDDLLDLGSQVALAASSIANSLTASSGYPTTISSNTSLSLSNSGVAVLKLSDFKLSNATLTLTGTAASYYVIDIANNFSLSSANVKLSGGLTWDHVLFNVTGKTGTTSLTGSSEFNGILLAANRNVTLSDSSKIVGSLIANTVNLSGTASVRCPTVSP